MFLGKNSSDKDKEDYFNNSYYVDADEEYYDEKCIGSFLETIRKIWWIHF